MRHSSNKNWQVSSLRRVNFKINNEELQPSVADRHWRVYYTCWKTSDITVACLWWRVNWVHRYCVLSAYECPGTAQRLLFWNNDKCLLLALSTWYTEQGQSISPSVCLYVPSSHHTPLLYWRARNIHQLLHGQRPAGECGQCHIASICSSWTQTCYTQLGPNLHTHTHPFNGPFPGLPRWASIRKVKTIWILLKQETVSGSGICWAICNSAPRSR